MAIVTKLFDFAADYQGFSGAIGGSGMSYGFDGTVGNPPGALKMSLGGKNANRANFWEYTGTWESLGVPVGSTVTAIRLDSASVRCTAFTTATSAKSGPYDLRDSGGTTVLATLWAGRTATAVDAAWVAVAAQADQAIPSAQQPSGTTVRLRLNNTLVTPNTTGATVTVYDDQVSLVITYTPPPTPTPTPTPSDQPAALFAHF